MREAEAGREPGVFTKTGRGDVGGECAGADDGRIPRRRRLGEEWRCCGVIGAAAVPAAAVDGKGGGRCAGLGLAAADGKRDELVDALSGRRAAEEGRDEAARDEPAEEGRDGEATTITGLAPVPRMSEAAAPPPRAAS